MSLNQTVSGERLHIGFFGKRNAGKSSLVNAVTGQELSVVSDVAGTTTDPVKKAMELFPIGPVLITDTAGFDGLKVFTVRGIIAFLVVFGWVGVLMDHAGIKLWVTALVSTLCGAAMMLLMALLVRSVMRLRNDGNIDNRNAIGTAGKVQLTIPPARTGEGKVHLILQGSYVERNAVTDDEVAIPTGSEVVVVGVSGQTDLVVRRK